ncbi:hypothetical protein [Tabrizicola sp.]|uniref:hypothetical protein n=1 Tax=Tabrizicola sp. TaxID=2005166 RepID=UPI0035AF204F
MASFIALARPNGLTAWVNPDNIAFMTEYGKGMTSIHFVGGGDPVVVGVEPDDITILVERENSARR